MNNSSSIRVANVIEEARIGGPQLRIMKVARELASQNIQTIVYTASAESDEFTRSLKKQELEFRLVNLFRLQRGLANYVRYAINTPFTVWSLRKLLIRDKINLVHANSAAQWRPVFSAWLAGIPVVWHLNDTNMPAIVRKLFGLMERFATGFIVAGHRVEEYYLTGRARGRPVFHVPAPVDFSSREMDNLELKAAKEEDSVWFANVGHINPDKDILTLVRTAAKVQQAGYDNIKFVHVGARNKSQAQYINQVDRMVDDLRIENMEFLGKRSDVKSVLSICDFYICTSRSEASPTSVWEALACGLPLISTDVGDIGRFCESECIGKVVPVSDDNALANAVTDMAANREAWTKEKRAIISKFAMKEFSIRSVAQKHHSIYMQLADRS